MAYSLTKFFFFSWFWLSFTNLSQAQVIPDNTLPQNSIIKSDCTTSCQIEGGTTRNSNLFHSYEEFSVSPDVEAVFNHSPNIKNIFTRVTGRFPSNIEGTISTQIDDNIDNQGSANLFLINPNGIMFGANAMLNIGGSFLATTAESIFFADNSQFSATNSQNSALLTVSVPIGLQFGAKIGNIYNQAERIDSNGSLIGIAVRPEKTLALLGGSILLEGGFLKAPSGKVELGSVAANSFVRLKTTSDSLSFSYQNVENFLDISLLDQARIVTSDFDNILSGDVRINARHIELKDQSIISLINSSNKDGGSIFIEGEQLVLQDSSRIRVFTDGNGRAGNIIINVDRIELVDTDTNIDKTGLFSEAFPSFPSFFSSTAGSSGNINIDTRQLTIRDGAQIAVSTLSSGKGGSLVINASETVKVIGRTADNIFPSALFAQSDGGRATGDAGDLHINTGKLIVQDGGNISVGAIEEKTNPFRIGISEGNGGKLVINATESIKVSGFGFDEQGEIAPSTLLSESQGIGNAGNIEIATPKLTVTNGGEINVSATGTGEAGSLNLNAQDIVLDRGTLTAETQAGDKGNINLNNLDTLLLRNNSNITTNATKEATGGDININSKGIALIDQSNITANAVEGRGGNINITTQRLFQEPDSKITATSEFNLDGKITIKSPDVDPTSGLIELPDVPIDAATILAQDLCKFEDDKIAKGSSFIITGRGGLTPTSADPLENLDRVVRWANRDDIKVSKNGLVGVRQRSDSDTAEKSYPVIQQAQGWITTSDGSVWLVANAPETIPQNSRIVHPNCRTSESETTN